MQSKVTSRSVCIADRRRLLNYFLCLRINGVLQCTDSADFKAKGYFFYVTKLVTSPELDQILLSNSVFATNVSCECSRNWHHLPFVTRAEENY